MSEAIDVATMRHLTARFFPSVSDPHSVMEIEKLKERIAREEEVLEDAIREGIVKRYSPEWTTAQENINIDKKLLLFQQQGEMALFIPPTFSL